jgi:5-hydroxyisourate hydrolase-like protein (transthyretin family)
MKKFLVILIAAGALLIPAVVASSTTCKVVDAKGKLISGARVAAWPHSPESEMRAFVTDKNGDISLPSGAQLSGSDVKLKLTDPFGKALVGAKVWMPSPDTQIARGVTNGKGEFGFVLKSAPRPKGFFGVRAVDSLGKAAANARLSPSGVPMGGLALDGKGEFSYEPIPRGLSESIQIVAAADGYAYASATVPSSRTKSVVIRLSREIPARLRVIDENGKPVGGARAVLQRAGFQSGKTYVSTDGHEWSMPSLAEAKTAGDGTFTVHHLPALKSCKALSLDLEISKPGYATINKYFDLGSPVKLSSIVMPFESTIEGTAYRPGKSGPLPQGTLLQIEHTANIIRGRTVAVDRNGRFRVSGLAAGNVTIYPALPPTNVDQGWTLPANAHIMLKSKEVKAVDVVAIKGAVLQGTVLDEATGKPMPDILVAVDRNQPSWRALEWTVTDAQGRFHLRVAPGDVKLEAVLMHGIERSTEYSKSIEMHLADGDVKDKLEIRLGPSVTE